MTGRQCTRSISANCDDRDLVPVRLYLRRDERLICAACRAAMDAMGATYTVAERRDEERPFAGPRWLANLRAVDRTERIA